jgi:hypothetical protein
MVSYYRVQMVAPFLAFSPKPLQISLEPPFDRLGPLDEPSTTIGNYNRDQVYGGI